VPRVRRDRPRLLRQVDGNVQRAAHASTASGAATSRRPRAVVRRYRPRLLRPAANCAPACPRMCRTRRVAIAASRARPRASPVTRPIPPATVSGGMRAGRPTFVPHPSPRDCREPSTSPCSSCDATAPTCYGRRMGMCNAVTGGPRECRIRRLTIAARPGAVRATQPPPPAMAVGRAVRRAAHVCAASHGSRL
jgi:hypothetical protein